MLTGIGYSLNHVVRLCLRINISRLVHASAIEIDLFESSDCVHFACFDITITSLLITCCGNTSTRIEPFLWSDLTSSLATSELQQVKNWKTASRLCRFGITARLEKKWKPLNVRHCSSMLMMFCAIHVYHIVHSKKG